MAVGLGECSRSDSSPGGARSGIPNSMPRCGATGGAKGPDLRAGLDWIRYRARAFRRDDTRRTASRTFLGGPDAEIRRERAIGARRINEPRGPHPRTRPGDPDNHIRATQPARARCASTRQAGRTPDLHPVVTRNWTRCLSSTPRARWRGHVSRGGKSCETNGVVVARPELTT